MRTLFIVGTLSFFMGGCVTAGFVGCQWKTPPPVIIPPDPIKQELSRLDIIQPICEPAFVEKNGDGLCREMFCQAQSHGDATTESTCENIINVRNKIQIQNHCQSVDEAHRAQCIDLFFRRGS